VRQKYILTAMQGSKLLRPTIVADKYDVSVTAAVKDFAHLVHLGLVRKTGRGGPAASGLLNNIKHMD